MSETASVGRVPSVVSVQAVALYDSRGQIRHMHHIVVLEGAKAPDRDVVTRQAVDHAKQMGHDVTRLQTLFVADVPDPQAMYRVDTKRRVLVAIEPPPPIGRAPSSKVTMRRSTK
jgi:hypothetical protein